MTSDLLIVGAGISGLGLAREAVSRGYSVKLFERSSLASEASANSLRIMHGGFRYLQTLNFKRIFESLEAQRELAWHYPGIMEPLGCVMPLARRGLKSGLPVRGALIAYSLLYRLLTGARYEGVVLKTRDVEAIEICKGLAPFGALRWSDLLLRDPKRLVETLRAEIESRGGIIFENNPVQEIRKIGEKYLVRSQSGEHFARAVINCAGWRMAELRPLTIRNRFPLYRWCRAFNVRLSRLLEPKLAVGISSAEGRLFFVVPRDGVSVVGTGYLPFTHSAEVTHEEAEEFIRDFSSLFPYKNVSESDVDSVESGVLPLTMRGSSFELQPRGVFNFHDGYGELLCTKYTTFLTQGRAVLSRILGFLAR